MDNQKYYKMMYMGAGTERDCIDRIVRKAQLDVLEEVLYEGKEMPPKSTMGNVHRLRIERKINQLNRRE